MEAFDANDKHELVKEMLDILVVSGYESYLLTGDVYSNTRSNVELGIAFDILRETKSLGVTLHYTQSILEQLGCDLDKAVDEVLKENTSKFPTYLELQDAKEDDIFSEHGTRCPIEWQIKELESSRYGGITAEKVVDSEGVERYIFFCKTEWGVEKRKYLKAVTFKKGDLSNIWS
jgi:hypothetical protein